MSDAKLSVKERVVDVAARGALGLALALPYGPRVRTFGWLFSRIISPLAGWRRRVMNNLTYAMPELSDAQRRQLALTVPDNVGRALIEIYSGEEFLERTRTAERTGPGVDAFEAARKAGQPIILMTAHLGNYDAVRGTLNREGPPIAGLYKAMTNRAFNAHYVNAISKIGEPVFPTDRRGITGYLRHLKNGGTVGIVADVATTSAPLLTFFGKPAHTPLSSAQWAIDNDALLIPVFGIRKSDGLSFELRIESPIEHSTPEAMTQTYNDIVERIVREDPGQWFWIHNRWKLGRGVAQELGLNN